MIMTMICPSISNGSCIHPHWKNRAVKKAKGRPNNPETCTVSFFDCNLSIYSNCRINKVKELCKY